MIEDASGRPTVEMIRAEVDAGTRVLHDPDGSMFAALNIEPLDPGNWLLNKLRVRRGATWEHRAAAAGLITESLAQANQLGRSRYPTGTGFQATRRRPGGGVPAPREPVEEKAPCDVIVTFLDALAEVSSQRQAIRNTFGAWKDDPGLDDLWEIIRADRDRWNERGR